MYRTLTFVCFNLKRHALVILVSSTRPKLHDIFERFYMLLKDGYAQFCKKIALASDPFYSPTELHQYIQFGKIVVFLFSKNIIYLCSFYFLALFII